MGYGGVEGVEKRGDSGGGKEGGTSDPKRVYPGVRRRREKAASGEGTRRGEVGE
jgi:hypothetical protein